MRVVTTDYGVFIVENNDSAEMLRIKLKEVGIEVTMDIPHIIKNSEEGIATVFANRQLQEENGDCV